MKYTFILAMACTVLFSGCKKTADEANKPATEDKMTQEDLDKIGQDDASANEQLATLETQIGSGFAVSETMNKVSFMDLFDAEIDENGKVFAQFKNISSESFEMVFSKDDCSLEKFCIDRQEDRCRAIAIYNIGGGVDPYLFMIMEDGHVEGVAIYHLSCGKTESDLCSSNKGITMLDEVEATEGPEEEFGGTKIVGIDAEGNMVDLNWE